MNSYQKFQTEQRKLASKEIISKVRVFNGKTFKFHSHTTRKDIATETKKDLQAHGHNVRITRLDKYYTLWVK